MSCKHDLDQVYCDKCHHEEITMTDSTIEEKGPWSARYYNDNHTAVIESDDFTHDVTMVVYGDFESPEQKLEYAQEIARRLNLYKE